MSTYNRMAERDELPNLPAEAFAESGESEINDAWLKKANFDEQTAAMEHWFLARFCDPAEETPYMSSEGGVHLDQRGTL